MKPETLVKLLIAIVLGAMTLLGTGCSKEEEKARLEASFPSGSQLSSTSTGLFLKVVSDGAYDIAVGYPGGDAEPWCTPALRSSAGEQMIWLTVTPNTSTSDRTVTLTVSSSGRSVSLTLTQKGHTVPPDPDVTLAAWFEEQPVIEWNETAPELTVICSTSWELAITYRSQSTGWCTPSATTGTGSATVSLNVGNNDSETTRIADITVSAGGKVETLTLTQYGKTPVTLSAAFASAPYLSSQAGSIALNVTSNSPWTVSVSYPAGTSSWCSTSTGSGSGNGSATISAQANTSSSARTATVTVSAPPRSVELTLTQYGQSVLPSNDRYELAAIAEPEWFLEYTAGEFAMEYSIEKKHPKWVAWKLQAKNFGSTKRTNAWQQDSRIPSQYRAYDADFSGYTRGHMCPSGERTESRAQNEQTFFYSNMSPQISGLNSGVWLQLENFERSWAKDDGDILWICCGAPLHREDWIIKYSSANNVAIPKYNFKVILRQKKGSSDYTALGFWFENKSYGGNDKKTFLNNLNNIVKSVDEIEEMTGYDFFHLLPENIQNAVEANKSTSGWGLN